MGRKPTILGRPLTGAEREARRRQRKADRIADMAAEIRRLRGVMRKAATEATSQRQSRKWLIDALEGDDEA